MDLTTAAHKGTYRTNVLDGHNRTRIEIERARDNDGAIQAYQTETSYLPTGEPLAIARSASDGSTLSVVRWMLYDSLGRRVLNAEPHVSAAFNPDPAAPASSVRALRCLRHSQPILRLVLEKEAKGDKEAGRYDELRTTREHPFWLQGTGWTAAGDLLPGEQVADRHGGWLQVHSSTWEQERADVHNLSVANTRTYFVGENVAWVHNNCAAGGAERGVFSVGPYRPPSAAPLENHHGVLDVWASHNIPGYASRGASTPTIALTEAQHTATKAVYRDWLFEQTGRRVGGSVN